MTIVLLIIFTFMFIPLIIAEIARNRSSLTLGDFFLQGRSMPLVMLFFTVYSTWVSSFAFLGSSTSFYYNGPLYMTCFAWNVLFALLFMVIGRRIWYYGKAHNYITPTDFFEDIYRSKFLSFTITMILIVFTIPYLVIQLFSGAILIEAVSEGMIPWTTAGMLFYFVIIIYLWAGGLRAVAMTDVFYGVLIFISMIMTGLIFVKEAGGLYNIFHGISEYDADFFKLNVIEGQNSALAWISMFIIVPIGALMGPPMWIRMYAASSEKIFKIMPLLLTLVTIMYLGPLLAGTAAKYMYPQANFEDNMLVLIIIDKVPIIFAALLLCGIASASLSTANSQIHALAAVYTIDIHKRYLKRHKISERELLTVGKWAVLIISIIAYILMLNAPINIIDIGMLSFAGTIQIFSPTVGALFWERSNPIAAASSIYGGLALTFILFFLFDVQIMYASLTAFAFNIIVFITVCCFTKGKTDTYNRIIKYQNQYMNRTFI